MKLKECAHPEPKTFTFADKTSINYCPACGAIRSSIVGGAEWEPTNVHRDLRRWIVAEPNDANVSPLAERRAWEVFAAANVPFAAAMITQEHQSAVDLDGPGFGPEQQQDMINALAASMADRMMGLEWARRFAPETKPEGGR